MRADVRGREAHLHSAKRISASVSLQRVRPDVSRVDPSGDRSRTRAVRLRRRPSSTSLEVRGKGGALMSEIAGDSLEEARRYVRRKRIFYTVVGVWIALSLMWFAIDMADDSSSVWFYWPMLGTGIGVVITGIVLLGIGGLFGAEWERREIDRYLRRSGKQPHA
jgi:hypothetical protein